MVSAHDHYASSDEAGDETVEMTNGIKRIALKALDTPDSPISSTPDENDAPVEVGMHCELKNL